MTQRIACAQRPSCEGMDNPPADGWRQLLYAVNSDPATAQAALPFSTDIRYFPEEP
jgi:hypothetical protein